MNDSHMVFIAAEFTNLLEPQLLSVGMVTSEGQELYLELGLQSDLGRKRVAQASWFVRCAGVLHQWGAVPGAACSAREMAERCGRWLIGRTEKAGGPIKLAFSESEVIWLLEDALRDCGMWDQVRPCIEPIDISALVATTDAVLAAEAGLRELAARGLRVHHALADAHALRASFEAVSRLEFDREPC